MLYEDYTLTEESVVLQSRESTLLETFESGYAELVLKRLFDFTMAFAVIVLLCSWLVPIIALIIRLDSKGPIFYRQLRKGLYSRNFLCWKFRTMYVDDCQDSQFIATVRNDSRITKIGSFLRASNIDELPQIINVLLGDMSIVGPRPQPLAFYEKYKEFVDNLDERHLIKPGITGWAQVKGLRGDLADEEANKKQIRKRVKLDIWYVENWSIALDVKIIWMTAISMIKGNENAY